MGGVLLLFGTMSTSSIIKGNSFLTAYLEANKKLIVSTRNMENAEENLRHANLGFEEGVIPALNLMQAQTAWVSARSCLIDAQIEVKLTEVYLTKAMGKLGDELSGRTRNAD